MSVEQSGRPFLIIKENRVQSKPQLILIWGIPANTVEEAIANIEEHGYCVLEDLLEPAEADRFPPAPTSSTPRLE